MRDVPGASGQSKRLLLGVGLVALVLAAFMVGRFTSSDPTPEAPESNAGQFPNPGPTAELNGVPVGYTQTEEGAVAAAAGFAKVMSSTTDEPTTYLKAFETIAAPAWREDARTLAEEGLSFVREQYGSDSVLAFVPVRYRVDTYGSSSATVEVWGVTLVSDPRGGRLEESWVTGTLELEWTSGDWRVAGGQSRAGPTPELVQTQEAGSAGELSGFREFTRAPAP